ncbi:unnamed protein product [Lepeophtheirus salmonis]|uniref:(salmon louse) hypothetical protein n=1 Tax=Lepeophtheirus salmonis TaxID=72036 RepID=A0A7R8H6F0_LEPSM|nr:unnamed protein product [Lepeophtheirus salmonis]CAF2900455.1 unnamed protein product [Lepeophtheirus salmonis]
MAALRVRKGPIMERRRVRELERENERGRSGAGVSANKNDRQVAPIGPMFSWDPGCCSKGTVRCQEMCESKFAGNEVKGCETGCRMMDIEESLTMGFDNIPAIQSRCQRSCGSSFGPTKETIEACSHGCEFMVPNIKKRHQSQRNPFENFFVLTQKKTEWRNQS